MNAKRRRLSRTAERVAVKGSVSGTRGRWRSWSWWPTLPDQTSPDISEGRPKVHVIQVFDGLPPQTQTNAGIPFHPTETLEVQIIGKRHRVDIIFEVLKIGRYEMYQEEEVKQRYRDLSATIGPDLMHNSEGWTCFICGRPATDIDWMAVWTPGEKVYKRCVVTIRAGCEGCTPKMEKDTLMFSERANRHRVGGGYVFGAIPKPEGMSGPSGACLTCRKETSATQELNMSRYCRIRRFIDGYVPSVACQKQDWARHKPVRSVAVPPDIGLKLLHRSAAKFEVFPGLIARRSNARLSSSMVTIGQGSDEYLLAGEEGLLDSALSKRSFRKTFFIELSHPFSARIFCISEKMKRFLNLDTQTTTEGRWAETSVPEKALILTWVT
ncbi:hypothetical protein B0H13DRAFT_1903556 [Mycena leptocephala]|nr:hypothetical protein B0H13DRAFT_1903556 [Mycena leptocephala]